MKVPVVQDIMTRKVFTLKQDLDIHDAIKELLRTKHSGAPVTGEGDLLVGVLSEKDCLRVFSEEAYEDQHMPIGKVGDFMRRDISSIGPHDDLFRVADIFFAKSFRRLPVVEEGRIIGIISRKDILAACIKLWQSIPGGKPWSDSKYLSDDLKAMLADKGHVDRSEVRVDSTE